MDSVKVQIIIEKLRSQGRMVFIEGATEEQIAAFEHEHKVSLPGKYKEWLRFSDGGELFLPAGIQLYGVTHKPLIDVENNDRPVERYIVIGAMAFGDPILFERESEKIAIYNHEAGTIEDDEIYEDFFAFLNDLYDMLGSGVDIVS